jgi:hypothetical protein
MAHFIPLKKMNKKAKDLRKYLPKRYGNCMAYWLISFPTETPDSHQNSESPS